MSAPVDLLVVGGGINGVGIARDAAGRGLKVVLCEQGDLGGATSSASSKMIHGGLRYLEHGEFRLVRESLAERAVLMRMAPHLVQPMRFVLPHRPGLRPRWLVRAGLFLYDRLGGAGALPASRAVDLAGSAFAAPLAPDVRAGFVYSDCVTDDARLVIANARDAAGRGAQILPRTALVSAQRDGGTWHAALSDGREVAARVLVNAAGPWVERVQRLAGLRAGAALRLVKGSHIVTRRLYAGDHAYLLQNDDRRVVFVLPFEDAFTLIGTTELPFSGDPAAAAISAAEVEYLCRAVGRWFARAPRPDDVVWSYAGVRPLYEDRAASAAAVTRDYVFDLDEAGPPALSVFGGKLTTFRRLAEHALGRLRRHLPGMGPAWTAFSILPGGEAPHGARAVPPRLARTYGSEARHILAAPPGREFGAGFGEAELRWLVEEEWAQTAEDVLWRRTKLGLVAPELAGPVSEYLAAAGLRAGQSRDR